MNTMQYKLVTFVLFSSITLLNNAQIYSTTDSLFQFMDMHPHYSHNQHLTDVCVFIMSQLGSFHAACF